MRSILSKKSFKKASALILGTFLTLAATESFASTFTASYNSGKTWNDKQTWTVNGTQPSTGPTSSDDVIIPAGQQIDIKSGEIASCKTLTIEGTGILNNTSGTLNIGAGNSSIAGTFNNTGAVNLAASGILSISVTTFPAGTFNFNAASTLILNGTAVQTLPAINFGNLEISNTAGVNLSRALTTTNLLGNLTIRTGGKLNNKTFAIGGTNTKAFTLESGAELILEGATTINNVSGFQTNSIDATSTINYNSTNTATSIPGGTYGQLTLSGNTQITRTFSGDVILNGNATINVPLSLAGGAIQINDKNLNIASGVLTGFTSSKFIKVTTGSLSIGNIGASSVIFPIGNGSYTPATISNTGTAQTFTVAIDNSVSGAQDHVVNKTWNVSAGGATGTANISLTLQWNSGDVLDKFNPNASLINHMVGGKWETKGNTPTAATLVSTEPNSFTQTRSGITSFSPFAVGDNVSPLPVELVSFQAVKKDAAVVLNWETATEKNNKGFEVQASANGKTFETIAFVASQNGTANYSQRYAYTDKVSGKEGMLYYRLKQVDLDGTITFSSVKAVDLGRTSTVVTAFPNPFQNQFELSLQTSANQNATVIVTDLAGKIVYNATQTLQKGSNNLKVSLTNQPAGIYLIKATAGNQTYTNRLVKQ